MNKMVMTEKLANQLMDCLACVAISATGGIIQNENGDFNQKQMDFVEKYARETFYNILEAWEESMEKEWEIVEQGENHLTFFIKTIDNYLNYAII